MNSFEDIPFRTPSRSRRQAAEVDRSDLNFDKFSRTPDISYGRDSKFNRLDLYVPSAEQELFAFVLFIHGGGTSNESQGEVPSTWAVALLRAGIAVAQIDYRPFYDLAGSTNAKGHAFPSQIDDCKSALRFLRANASKYKLNPERVGVMGESFGGYLASLVGTTGDIPSFGDAPSLPDQKSSVNAACSVSGMTDMRVYVKQADAHRFALGYDWPELDTTGRFYLQAMTNSQKEQSSPVFHVDSRDPPFLIIQGFDDASVPPYQADLLFVKLRNAGVDATCQLIPGGSHGGPPLNTPASRGEVARFFAKHLIEKSGG